MSCPMNIPDLYVIRHGQTEWNSQQRFQGVYDSPLTPRGEQQAIDMGQKLITARVSPSSHDFQTSPQGRSRETARLALNPIGAVAAPNELLREISVGEWNGLSREEINARWPGPEDEHFIDMYARAPGGESFDSLWDRVGAFLNGLERPTVVFTHGFTSRFLRTRAMGLTLADLDHYPGGQGVIFHLTQGEHRFL